MRGRVYGLRRQHKLDRLIDRDGLLCHWCREPFGFDHPITFDHLIPVKYGGNCEDDNLVLACARCNTDRHHHAFCGGCGRQVKRNGIPWQRAPWHARCLPETVAAS